MNRMFCAVAAACAPFTVSAQGALTPTLPPGNIAPTPEETRADMAVPSAGDLRGQKDGVGFAVTAAQMAEAWELSAAGPRPEALGPMPPAGVAGLICPHDDYLCAGPMYREAIPLVTARTVILVGVFHRHRRYSVQDLMVFDPYRAWRSPDGEIPVSGLREELLARLAPGEFAQSAVWHDSEHSLEAIAYWLKHQNPDLEILPVILPATAFNRLQLLAEHLGAALAGIMKERGWALGEDVAVVISSDGTHYGERYHYTPFGEGGVDTYLEAMETDRRMLKDLFAGPVGAAMARTFYASMTDPDQPTCFRGAWCGRFSIPFGLMLMAAAARGLGQAPPVAARAALGSSLGFPQLPAQEPGLGLTNPINLYHFVSYPTVAFVAGAALERKSS